MDGVRIYSVERSKKPNQRINLLLIKCIEKGTWIKHQFQLQNISNYHVLTYTSVKQKHDTFLNYFRLTICFKSTGKC